MWLQAANFSYLGIFFGIAVVIGYTAGIWADRRLHTAPWLSFVGLMLGVAAGFRELIRLTRRYLRQLAAEDKAEQAQRKTSESSPDLKVDLKE